MIERAHGVAVAQEWLDAWNAHDPERVVEHFTDDVVTEALRLRDDGLASEVRVCYGA